MVVTTRVVVAGPVSNNKGINLPGVAVNVPALSDKDKADLRWGLELGADLIALSFVRNAADITRVHEIMDEVGRRVPVIAKIEKPQAVDALDEIIEAFDAIMVARGDLGVELPLEAVPIVQKRAVEIAPSRAKPVIVATQMLESMIHSPVPTRAETSDVANADPRRRRRGDALRRDERRRVPGDDGEDDGAHRRVDRGARAGAHPAARHEAAHAGRRDHAAAVEVADFVEAKYLCVFTETGESVRRMTRIRSVIPILAFTPDPAIRRRMSLNWGVESFVVDRVTHTDQMVGQVDEVLAKTGMAENGEKVVIISGSPPGIPGTTNDVRVHVVGEVL